MLAMADRVLVIRRFSPAVTLAVAACRRPTPMLDAAAVDVEEARARGQRLGLTSMDERASSIRGRLNIVSKPGEGTTVTLEAPLE